MKQSCPTAAVDSGLPFPVKTPPVGRHPRAGILILFIARFVMVLGHAGKAAALAAVLLFPLAGVIYALVAGGVIELSYDEGSRPFSPDEFIAFASGTLILAASGLLIDPAGKKLLYFGRRLRAKDALSVLRQDHRRPVLFLRSFDHDQLDDPTLTGPLMWKQQRYEERLSRILEHLGPVVCLGRPGESLSQAGAARLYVDNEYWQEAVLYFLNGSRVVVIMVGDTRGLRWEIETAAAKIEPSQILFFFPYVASTNGRQTSWHRFVQRLFPTFTPKHIYHRMENERQQRYKQFRERLGSLFSGELPERLGQEQFMEFTGDGRARFLKVRRPVSSNFAAFFQKAYLMHVNISRTLRPFLLKHSVTRH